MRSHPIAVALVILSAATLSAQKHYKHHSYSEPVDGDETCRAIWDEYGRTMTGDPVAVYCEVREVGTRAAPSMINVDGGPRAGVMVEGEGRRDLRLRLVIQSQGRSVEDAKALTKDVGIDASSGTLRVTGIPGGNTRFDRQNDRRFVAVTILVTAPYESNLTAHVDYAPLSVENLRGRMDLRTEHGPLTLNNVGGDVRARVQYGPITVALDSSRWQGTRLDAEAEYGPMTLSVPRNFNADIEIGADHGPFDVDFPLTLTRFNGSSIETKLGAGGPPVRAIARYGPMSLKISR